jgi:two-component system, cell cycle sensor histidine kinase and response regulator CckA
VRKDSMPSADAQHKELLDEIASLQSRLQEAEETLRAIGSGEVDAFVVSGPSGEQVFTLEGADHTYRVMVETMQEGAVKLSADGTILYCNQRLSTLLQTPLESLIGMKFEAYVAAADLTFFRSLLESSEHQERGSELRLQTGAGNSLSAQISFGVNDHPGEMVTSMVITDLSERKRVEQDLAEARNILQAAMDQSPAGIALADAPDGKLRYVNDAGLLIRGGDRESVVNGIGLDQYVAAWKLLDFDGRPLNEDEVPLARAIMFGETASREFIIRRGEGDERVVLANAAPIKDDTGKVTAAVVVFTDITERKTAEEERQRFERMMFETQKLESLGLLAGGIAHDFNNILTAILGNAELALLRLKPESPALGNIQKIEEAATHAADLSQQMLAYSGKGKFVVDSLDMNHLLEEMIHILEVSVSKKAVLRLNLAPNLPSIEADATQIRQVVMNLIINASEAIGEKSGVISITTGCMDYQDSYLNNIWLHENLHDGLYLYLEVADTGSGMSQKVIDNIFDPFFTTKFTGRGLGMAAVLGIIKGHKGAIRIYSEPGKGTTFKILIPASGRPAEIFDMDASHDPQLWSGKVLLVDDEDTIRAIGTEMLKELGFCVITASDGREAIEIFRQTPGIDLVLLDLTMPHIDGEQCFRELRKLQPDIKIIVTSGYNEQEVSQKFIGRGLSGFLQKPFRFSSLREALRAIDDNPGGSAT